MPISFLAPLFLLGFAALAIPILIHLTDRERRDVVSFPSLMFVQRIPHQTVRRQRIRNWLLFLLRAAAIVLLVVAFARPLFDGPGAAETLRGGRDLVILLDRSYSMAYGDRWERAVAAADRAIGELGDGDRATLVAFAERAAAMTQPTGDPMRLRAALDGLEVTDGATRYAPAFQLAAQLLEGSELPRREVVLITDFQRTGFRLEDAVRLPPGTQVKPVNLAAENASNLAVLDVTVDRNAEGPVDQVSIAARLVNAGTEARSGVSVTLAIDGQRVATQSADIGPKAAEFVRFDEVPVPRRTALGTVSAGEDRLPRDNQFHFVIEPQRALSVVLLENPGATSRETVYLKRALAVGGDPRFAVVTRKPSQLREEDLVGRPAVVVNDVSFPPGASGRRLREYVERGGRLLVILGRRSTRGAWNGADGLLPGVMGEPVDRWIDGGAKLVILGYEHPALEVFKAPRSGDFSAARFFRYHAFEERENATVLARFDDGAVALAEHRVGRGSVVVLTTGLGNLWNDLAIQPVFLPLVHRLARYLSGYDPPRPWVTAGQVLDLNAYLPEEGLAGRESSSRELVVEAPSGERILRRLRDGDERYLEVWEQGFYRVRPLPDRTGLLATIAVNLAPAEADLSALDVDELVGAVSAAGGDASHAEASLLLLPEERERRQSLWWYLLVAVLLIFMAEAVLSNRGRSFGRQHAPRETR